MTARYPFSPVDSGQAFPPGLRVEPGAPCSQCGAARDRVHAICSMAGLQVVRRPCAECLADLVTGAELVPGSGIWVESDEPVGLVPKFKRVR